MEMIPTNVTLPEFVSMSDLSDAYTKCVRIEFPNGYEASVIQGEFTYGGKRGLFEVAVIKDENIQYDTPLGPDVLGYLTKEEMVNTLWKIASL